MLCCTLSTMLCCTLSTMLCCTLSTMLCCTLSTMLCCTLSTTVVNNHCSVVHGQQPLLTTINKLVLALVPTIVLCQDRTTIDRTILINIVNSLTLTLVPIEYCFLNMLSKVSKPKTYLLPSLSG